MKRWIAFLFTALIGWNIILTILFVQDRQDSSKGTSSSSEIPVQQASVNITSDVTELVSKSENKVVTVTSLSNGQEIGTGSGAIYKKDGNTVFIITNNHVVADGSEATVTFANGKEQEVEIVGKDELSDLALLKTEVDFDDEVFTMGDSSLVKKGEYVIAMGSPLGIEYQGSVSGGLISGVDRRMEVDTDDNGVSDWDVNVLQTDAAINPGNSGGPLINMAGELIGINSMKISDTSVEGFGFALPINEVLPIINELEKNGKVERPILGISVLPIEQLTEWDRLYLDIDDDVKNGLFVVKVQTGTPASSAGIRPGDVLVKFDNTEITNFKQYRQLLYNKKVGDKVEIIVERKGKEITKTVELE